MGGVKLGKEIRVIWEKNQLNFKIFESGALLDQYMGANNTTFFF